MKSLVVFNTFTNNIVEFVFMSLLLYKLSTNHFSMISLFSRALLIYFKFFFFLLHLRRVVKNKFIQIFIIIFLLESTFNRQLHDWKPSRCWWLIFLWIIIDYCDFFSKLFCWIIITIIGERFCFLTLFLRFNFLYTLHSFKLIVTKGSCLSTNSLSNLINRFWIGVVF